MDTYFSNKRWVAWTIGILVVLNLFTLSLFWFSNGPHADTRGRKPQERGKMDKFIARKLQLSEDQQEQVKVFRKTHRQLTKAAMKKMGELKTQRIDALTKTIPDTALVNELAHQIGFQQTTVENLLSEHYFHLRSICNEEQQKELVNVFRELAKRRGPKKKRE